MKFFLTLLITQVVFENVTCPGVTTLYGINNNTGNMVGNFNGCLYINDQGLNTDAAKRLKKAIGPLGFKSSSFWLDDDDGNDFMKSIRFSNGQNSMNIGPAGISLKQPNSKMKLKPGKISFKDQDSKVNLQSGEINIETANPNKRFGVVNDRRNNVWITPQNSRFYSKPRSQNVEDKTETTVADTIINGRRRCPKIKHISSVKKTSTTVWINGKIVYKAPKGSILRINNYVITLNGKIACDLKTGTLHISSL